MTAEQQTFEARVVQLLEQLHDQQTQQLANQARSLSIQEEQFARLMKDVEAQQQQQLRADALLTKAASIQTMSVRILKFILPAALVIVLTLIWLR